MPPVDAETGTGMSVGELPEGAMGTSVAEAEAGVELGITPVGPNVMAV